MALNHPLDLEPTVPRLKLGIASAPYQGERHSGDRFVVRPTRDGTLVAAIDGLGHGDEAAHAAAVAAQSIERYAGEPLQRLAALTHHALRYERGAALSLAWFDRRRDRVQWLGVGSAQGALVQHDETLGPQVRALLVRSGTLGDRLPQLQPTEFPFPPGDNLVLATDGVRATFLEALRRLDGLPPDQLAARLLEDHARNDDDALVLVVHHAEVD